MLQTITRALQDGSGSASAPALAFALGLVSAVASACCTLPAMGMLVAYSGTRQITERRSTLTAALWFLLGTTLALVILGFVAGLVGQAAQAWLGRYWKLFAGVVAVLVGLVALRLLPLPTLGRPSATGRPAMAAGGISAALGGLFLGGGVAACSLPCNPGIFIVLGAAVLQGRALWGMVLMAAFAVGFSLPLAAILFGVSFGKASVKAGKLERIIRGAAGILLIGAGFYLLASF
jgi:cytochrome c biogenesis protein CcdA